MGGEKIINLDLCVINALELFSKKNVPIMDFNFKRPLIVGSGNAEVVGRILFQDKDAIFANESNYIEKIKNIKEIDGAILISASGGKHSPIIAKYLKKKKIKTVLLTNNPNAISGKYVDKVYLFPKNEEPYTYNTSTYLGMLLSKTKENPEKILNYLKGLKHLDFKGYNSFFIILPEKFDNAKEMFQTKFDELFGPKIKGRIFTYEQTKHAKTIISDKKELFIGLGVKNKTFGEKRMNISIPNNFDYVGIISLGYYLIGQIQKQNKPYFNENIETYVEKISKIFKEKIKIFS